jgi:ubiquitin-conjugating enzyme E2 D/E
MLQDAKIVLDVFPMACSNKSLLAVAKVTGGVCVDVNSVEQGTALFEEEPLLHVAARMKDPNAEPPQKIVGQGDFQRVLEGITTTVVQTSAGPARAVQVATAAPVMSKSQADVAKEVASQGSAALKRVLRELREIEGNPVFKVFLCSDVMQWKVTLPGPAGTPYEGGTFVLSITFPSDYPFKPPKVLFLTPTYHCNINSSGAVCLDILKSQWSPALTISHVLLSLQSLLDSPNPDDPLDSVKATLLREDPKAYHAAAVATTAQHAAPFEAVAQKFQLM